MKPDYQPNPYTVKRPRRGFLVVVAAIALLVTIAVVMRGLDAGEGERQSLRGANQAPAAEINRGSTDVVGTTGQDPAGTENNSGPAAVVPPAIIQDLETITGTNDGNQLIGRRVNLHVTVQDLANDTAFWVGERDNRVLVVLGRDNRDGAKRQQGEPAAHGISPVLAGQSAAISGTVQRLPKAEEMHSWRLTRHDAAELSDRGIYIRADQVKGSGHGAGGGR